MSLVSMSAENNVYLKRNINAMLKHFLGGRSRHFLSIFLNNIKPTTRCKYQTMCSKGRLNRQTQTEKIQVSSLSACANTCIDVYGKLTYKGTMCLCRFCIFDQVNRSTEIHTG